jgi:Spy/CpxP family protein refolding chaperone
MTHKLIGIGATVAAVALAAAFVTAQGTTGQAQAGGPPVVQGQEPPPQGQIGPGRGLGPGRGPGPGQGLGPGQQLGPQAGRGGPMMGRGRGQGLGPQGPAAGRGRGVAALDLTDDQRAKITDLQRATRDQAAPLEDELAFTRKTLNRELFADKRDTAKVTTLTAKIATLEKQLADLHVKNAMAVADLLTPKQRETMRLMEGRRGGPGGGAAGPGGAGLGRGGIGRGPQGAGRTPQ